MKSKKRSQGRISGAVFFVSYYYFAKPAFGEIIDIAIFTLLR